MQQLLVVFLGTIAFFYNALVYSEETYSEEVERLAPELMEQASISKVDESAEVLYAISKTQLKDDFFEETVSYYSIRVNDEEAARDYGRIALSFNHFYSDTSLQFANVLTPEKKIKPLSDDAVQVRVGSPQDFYSERSQIVFSLPEVEAGSILEFQFVSKTIKLAMPGLFSTVSNNYWYQPTVSGQSGRIDYVHQADFELTASKSIPLKIQQLGDKKPFYKKVRQKDKVVHRWQWKKQAMIPIEPAMPWYEELLQRVRISTSKDWKKLDKWVWGLTHDKMQVTPELEKIANGLIDKDASRQDKIAAVYAYMQNNIRYVYAHLGRGGYEPHLTSEILNHAYGDCKDQSVLSIALLKALGIEAFPALVVTPSNDRPSLDLVALYFDHMIVWIPDEKGGSWMDTSGERPLFPGVNNALLDQPAFIVNGKGGVKTKIKHVDYANQAAMDMHYFIDKQGQLILDLSVSFSGILEQSFRNWWFHLDDRETALDSLIKTQLSESSAQATIDAWVKHKDDLLQPFTLGARINLGEPVAKNEDAFLVGTSVWNIFHLIGEFKSLPLPANRKNIWVSYQDLSLSMQVRMSGREGDSAVLLKSALDEKNQFFTITQSAQKLDDGFSIAIDYKIDAFQLTPDDYAKFYQRTKSIVDLGVWEVGFYGEKNVAAEDEDVSPGSTAIAFIGQARQHIENAQFEKAAAAATSAIEISESNGEAWYVLGVAKGFLADLEGSQQAFTKAKEFGYVPGSQL